MSATMDMFAWRDGVTVDLRRLPEACANRHTLNIGVSGADLSLYCEVSDLRAIFNTLNDYLFNEVDGAVWEASEKEAMA